MKEITSLANPLVKQWRQMQTPSGRKAHGLFLAEGEHLCREAVREGACQTLLVTKEGLDAYREWLPVEDSIILVSRQVLSALADSKTPQGCIAVCELPESPPLQNAGNRLMALNRLQDPGNVGTILRTLDAADFDGLVLDFGCADPFSPKAARASMGAVFRLPVYQVEDLHTAFDALPKHKLVAGDLFGGPYYGHPPFGESFILLVGNEGAGLEDSVKQRADFRLKLPIPGKAESLNAAVAAGLMVYDIIRLDEQMA